MGEPKDTVPAAEAIEFMANNVLLSPDDVDQENAPRTTLRPLDSVTLTGDLEAAEPSLVSSLVASVRDVFFPAKLPPLELTSQPIPVVDRMAVKRDPVSTAIAIAVHVVAILLIGVLIAKKVGIISSPAPTVVMLEAPAPPPKAPPKAQIMGGGGGQKGPAPVAKGNPPQFKPDPDQPAEGASAGAAEDQYPGRR